MAARRLLTIPSLFALTLLSTALSPLVLPAAWLLSYLPGLQGALRTALFVLGYLWCETTGVLRAASVYLRVREQQAFLTANYHLQCWWVGLLEALARRLFDLRFEVSGEDALAGPAAIVILRHTSIADTIIPMAYYSIPYQVRLRYVLKKELLLDPCLDIVGNRLPNYFVDRGGEDTRQAAQGVANMMADLTPFEGALIYPEGTRYSRLKHARLMVRAAKNPEMLQLLERWPLLLPPRLGGTTAMLTANPGRDLIFCAHVGFDGSSHFSNLINGSWIRARIRIHFWRVPFHQIPESEDDLPAFLYAQWDTMHQWVAEQLSGS